MRARRFGAVMTETDAATEPPRRTQLAHSPQQDGDEPTATAETAAPTATEPPREPNAATKAVKAIGFHAGAIVLFAIPAVVLWWHVWTTHPSATLTCPCGDPAQQVWFTAWPAYALAHGHNLVFSQWVNTPHGANLLSNTSGTLVATLLAPITWAWGPITATNVALTLAPALSAWGCFVALRPLLKWKAAALPAALVFGYSAAIVTVAHLRPRVGDRPGDPADPLHPPARDRDPPGTLGPARRPLPGGPPRRAVLHLPGDPRPCALFWPSSASCAVLVVGWRQLRGRCRPRVPRPRPRRWRGRSSLLAYPVWFGLAGPQAVTGVLFVIAPLTGVPLSGVFSPGHYGASANSYVRLGGYRGRVGPPPDFIGIGAAAAAVAAFVLAWRRLLTWLVVFLAVVSVWLSLGRLPVRRVGLAQPPVAALA